jgi:hypothetical protein
MLVDIMCATWEHHTPCVRHAFRVRRANRTAIGSLLILWVPHTFIGNTRLTHFFFIQRPLFSSKKIIRVFKPLDVLPLG